MLLEIRLRTRFTLKKKDYEDTISRLRCGNAILQRLVKHNTSFESTRRARSHSKIARATRKVTKSLFLALRDAMGCNCSTHGLGLQLAQKQTLQLFDEEGELSGKGPHFEIVLESVSKEQRQHWDGLSIHCITKHLSVTTPNHVSMQTSASASSNTSIPSPAKGRSSVISNLWTKLRTEDNEEEISGSRNQKLGKRVRFSLLADSQIPQGTNTSKITPLAPEAAQNETGSPTPIVSLCHLLHKGKSIANNCVGYIKSNGSTRFDIYHRDYQPLVPRAITLREALLGQKAGLRDLALTDRLHIALMLSFSALHLCNTPWLKQVITLDDIIFLREESSSKLYDFTLGHPCPFLVNQITSSGTAHMNTAAMSSSSNSERRPVNFHVLSLGMLLTHIIAGHPVQEIEVEEHMSKEQLSPRRAFAREQVMTCDDASDNYIDAVQWCLDNSFTFATLEAESLRRDFYDAIIARLERDLSYLS